MLPYTIDNNNKLLVYRWNQQGVLNFCFVYRQKKLPSIEEAWALPIPAELTSRQGTISQVRNVAFIARSDTPTLHTGPGVTNSPQVNTQPHVWEFTLNLCTFLLKIWVRTKLSDLKILVTVRSGAIKFRQIHFWSDLIIPLYIPLVKVWLRWVSLSKCNGCGGGFGLLRNLLMVMITCTIKNFLII